MEKEADTSMIEFGYWPVKNLGEPIRWMMGYMNIPYQEYNPPTQEDWYMNKRASLRLDFPAMPYLIDGDVRLSDAKAIPYYLVIKAQMPDMIGKSLEDRAHLQMLECSLDDLKKMFWKVSFSDNNHQENMKKVIHPKSHATKRLQQFGRYLGPKEYFLGYLTIFDFQFAYTVDFLQCLIQSLKLTTPFTKALDNLLEHNRRIKMLNGVRQRVEFAKSLPFINPSMMPFPLLHNVQ